MDDAVIDDEDLAEFHEASSSVGGPGFSNSSAVVWL